MIDIFYHRNRKKAIIFSRFLWKGRMGGVFMKKQKEDIIVTDPFGSYTGRTKDPNDKPVQDADDL